MAARNDITGDPIQSKAPSKQYEENLSKVDFSIKLEVAPDAPPAYKLTQRTKAGYDRSNTQ
jgi:hypothetical protein